MVSKKPRQWPTLNCKECSRRVDCTIAPGHPIAFVASPTIKIPCEILRPIVSKIIYKLMKDRDLVSKKVKLPSSPFLQLPESKSRQVMVHIDCSPIAETIRRELTEQKYPTPYWLDVMPDRAFIIFGALDRYFNFHYHVQRLLIKRQKSISIRAGIWQAWSYD